MFLNIYAIMLLLEFMLIFYTYNEVSSIIKYNQLHCCLPLFVWQLVSLLSNMAFRNASSARRLSGAPVLMILTLALLATKSTAPSLWLAGRLTDQNNVELQPFTPNQSEISSPLFNVNLLSLTPNGRFLRHLHPCNPSSRTNAGILMLASSMWWYSGKSRADRQPLHGMLPARCQNSSLYGMWEMLPEDSYQVCKHNTKWLHSFQA